MYNTNYVNSTYGAQDIARGELAWAICSLQDIF